MKSKVFSDTLSIGYVYESLDVTITFKFLRVENLCNELEIKLEPFELMALISFALQQKK